MENPELLNKVTNLIEDLRRDLLEIEEAITGVSDQLSLLRSSAFPPPRVVRTGVSPTWPWTSATTTQGFLSGRWIRRDGNVYSPPAAVGHNSPVAGGESVGKSVNPTGDI